MTTGKSNVPEFAAGSHTFNPIFGTTVNPYDTTKSAAGSSGGAAAAIAAGVQASGDGSDMGGSLRLPASFNNIVGMRPTNGRIPHTLPEQPLVVARAVGLHGPDGERRRPADGHRLRTGRRRATVRAGARIRVRPARIPLARRAPARVGPARSADRLLDRSGRDAAGRPLRRRGRGPDGGFAHHRRWSRRRHGPRPPGRGRGLPRHPRLRVRRAATARRCAVTAIR